MSQLELNTLLSTSSFKLRAHHGLCILFFEGKGYDDNFVENMKNVIATLTQNPMVLVVFDEDIVCVACPNNSNGICDCNEKVDRYDKMVLRLCDMHSNTVLQWEAYKTLVKEKIIMTGKLSTVCGDCNWANICLKKAIE
ncbi:MAG TPA: DUF1284 domain-containing protein [Clostridiaceae bacterium]